MEIELKSDWQDTQVELLKTLQGYELSKVNDALGCVDYVSKSDDDGKRLLRVIVDPGFHASKVAVKTVETTMEDLEEGYYDEAVLVAESFTSASKMLLKKECNLEFISPKSEHYTTFELLDAIYRLTQHLCEARCGKFPSSEKDCKGYKNGEYVCPVRRISDDADFHAERNWNELLKNDFSRLVKFRREADS